MDRLYALHHWISCSSPKCTRGAVSNHNRRFQETFPSPWLPRLGVNPDNRLPGPDILRGSKMGKENDDGIHQYLLVNWRYQCQLYAGIWS